jgi:hypothetical protein
MSSSLRLFLAKIPRLRVNKNNKIVTQKDFLGGDVMLDFNKGYQDLQRVLSDLPPDWEVMKQRLLDYVGDDELAHADRIWMGELGLIKMIDDAGLEIRSEFVSDMTNHYVNMDILSYERQFVPYNSKKPEEGGFFMYNMVVKNANQASLSNGTMMAWADNLKNSTLLKYDGTVDDYKYTITEKDDARVLAKYNTLKNSLKPEDLIDYLSEFGIDFEMAAATELIKGDVMMMADGTRVKYSEVKGGVFKHLQKAFRKLYIDVNTPDKNGVIQPIYYKENTLIHQSSVQSLAQINSKFTPDLFVNSFNIGNKPINAIVNNKYAMDKARDLVANKNNILEDLSNTVYTRHSYYLQELLKSDPNAKNTQGSLFRDWFSLGYASLVPIEGPLNKSLDELTEAEHEVTKLGLFTSNMREGRFVDNGAKGHRVRKATYYSVSNSDKATVLSMKAMAFDLDYNKDGNIHNSQIDLIIDHLVMSEWDRIHATKDLGIPGHDLFYFFPEFNELEITVPSPDRKTVVIKSLSNIAMDNATIPAEVRTVLRSKINQRMNALTEAKLAFWSANDIAVDFHNSETGKLKVAGNMMDAKAATYLKAKVEAQGVDPAILEEKRVKYFMAKEMVFNYMFNLGNTFQMFIGDQALYYKESGLKEEMIDPKTGEITGNTVEDINRADYMQTIDNLGKRMAAEIAPGYPMANEVYETYFGTTEYMQVYINDSKESSREDILKYYNKLLKNTAHKYNKITATDGQEYTTLKEHLTTMLASGRIEKSEYDKIIRKSQDPNYILDQEELDLVLNPLKPVYTNSKQYDVGNTRLQKRTYIKSSSFPLLPQLTKGLVLDDIRIYLEKLEIKMDKPVRLAYGSAVKVGMPDLQLDLWNEDGTLNEIVEYDVDDKDTFNLKPKANVAFEKLDRSGFRIQQDVPFDPKKSTVNVGSQPTKLIFSNILGEIERFNHKGTMMSGDKLKARYNKLLNKQFERKLENFKHRFIDKETGIVKISKIQKILIAELERTEPPTQSERDGLAVNEKLGEFVTPLWLSPHSKKYSSLINAVLNKSLIDRKTRGKSKVLGSATGFKKQNEDSQTGIVYTESYNGSELLPMRPDPNDATKTLPAQIVIRMPFVDALGNILNAEDYIIDGKLDTSRLPKELLQSFSFRIPTQSHSSMAAVEIVGFLPATMGDLVIAPKEFIEQMGSDFDVDKLYNYFFNTYTDFKGVVHKIELNDDTKGNDLDKAIENEILEIHLTIMKTAAVLDKIITPLSFGQLGKFRDAMEEGKVKDSLQPTYLSDDYNRQKYMTGVSGKSGTAFFASATAFNAMVQLPGSSTVHMIKEHMDGSISRKTLGFGNRYNRWVGDFSNPYSSKKGNPRLKSEILAGFLSSSVDNEKERLLAALNINNSTFNVIGFMIQAGYEEDIILPFINQPAILEYMAAINKDKSILSDKENTSDERKEGITKAMLKKYKTAGSQKYGSFSGTDASEIMMELIVEGEGAHDYMQYQHALLQKFIYISETLVKPYSKSLKLGNVDSAKLGKDLTQAMFKSDEIEKALGNKAPFASTRLVNIQEAFDNSVSGMAYNNYHQGLHPFRSLFVHTDQHVAISKMMNQILSITNRDIDNIQVGQYEALTEAIKYYALALNSDERNRLLIGDSSVLSRLQKISNSDYFQENDFLNKLDIKGNKKKNYGIVTFKMNLTDEFTNDLIYRAFTDALTTNREIEGVNVRELMEDMTQYSILDGARWNPKTFSKYLQSIYFERLGINQYAKSLNLSDHAPHIIEQFIQHNPELVPKFLGPQEVVNGLNTFTINDKGLEKIGEDDLPLYVNNGKGKNLKLFKLMSDVYVQIDILGDGKSLLEYSKPSEEVTASSVIPKNKAVHDEGASVRGGSLTDALIESGAYGLDEKFIDETPLNLEVGEDQNLHEVLSKMNDPMAKAMVDLFSTRLKASQITLKKGMAGTGQTDGTTVWLKESFYKKGSSKEINETIIHESVHVITMWALNNRDLLSDDQNDIINQLIAYRLEMVKNLNPSEVSDFVVMIQHLSDFHYRDGKLQNKSDTEALAYAKRRIERSIGSMAGMHPEIDTALAEVKAQTLSNRVVNSINNKGWEASKKVFNYSLTDDYEFLANAAANKDFQNSINKKLGKTNGIDQIKELFRQFLELLGIDNTASGKIVDIMFEIGHMDTMIAGELITSSPDTKHSITGNDYLKQLIKEDLDYMLQLQAEGLIDIKC